ncbi:MAG: aminoglycoside phosphotransferase family protein [Oscillospiraceae bacterium]
MASDIKDIFRKFNVEMDIARFGDGHINDTYYADVEPNKYILQRINHEVFKDPGKLMDNIMAVTQHLRKKIISEGGNPKKETLNFIKTKTGENYYKDEDGNCYRMYIYVVAKTYQTVQTPQQFYASAKAFGKFQNRLSDFPADTLYETIPNFHNTSVRFNDLLASIKADKAGRKHLVEKEIEFALARQKDTNVINEAMQSGKVLLRVTHNDTKLNNVLFDLETDKAICVIDLDTVMPGSLLYDFGDSIRFGASSAAEDETDISKVYCDLNLFEAYTKGFLEEVGHNITKTELDLLSFSAKMMTYECGIRFLADFLDGDTYFKVHRENHNLDRARTQFKLVEDMEQKMDLMNEIVRKY